ncbi:acylneuraminate cytidylyltransferase family protein [Marinobacter sp. NP-4(2019)]|uniref:acylneuraminate cytidylyltransferase family protein n=1 Tax=Marinobacter sp. NP-4(2019) TaxID=2488665 RepID=UPI000FC3D5D3|nr:acylneuraminate cytidylyltransferase family protein [Marinobacter sp. NP-4(2019)]AZT84483.1 acylneuraminate cytidylyltransferase family protein [Marinobacter sp. NP-4(2019)]
MTVRDRNLVIIPARAGSRRLPRKNVLPLAGKPMICWTIEAALEANISTRIVVTSDDPEILKLLPHYPDTVIGVKRHPDLATDSAATIDVVRDVIAREERAGYHPDTIILLQPTSPLRQSEDIRNAVEIFRRGGGESVVSVCKVDHPLAWCGQVDSDGRLHGLDLKTPRRSQEYPADYRLNGAVYVAGMSTVKEHGSLFSDSLLACVMPRERSIDVDEELDFELSRLMLEKRTENSRK